MENFSLPHVPEVEINKGKARSFFTATMLNNIVLLLKTLRAFVGRTDLLELLIYISWGIEEERDV